MLLAWQSSASCTQLLLYAPAQQLWASAKEMFDVSGDGGAAGMAKQLSLCYSPQLLHNSWCKPQPALMSIIRWSYTYRAIYPFLHSGFPHPWDNKSVISHWSDVSLEVVEDREISSGQLILRVRQDSHRTGKKTPGYGEVQGWVN